MLSFEVSAEDLPAGVGTSTVSLAFWNGTDWTAVDATVVVNPDGSITVQAAVTHFTIFAVVMQPAKPFRGTFAPAGGLSLMRWDGLDSTSAAAAKLLPFGAGGAIYTLNQQEQRWFAYIVGAPEFVNTAFRLTHGQPVMVKTAPAR